MAPGMNESEAYCIGVGTPPTPPRRAANGDCELRTPVWLDEPYNNNNNNIRIQSYTQIHTKLSTTKLALEFKL